jgi:hypothetical protein
MFRVGHPAAGGDTRVHVCAVKSFNTVIKDGPLGGVPDCPDVPDRPADGLVDRSRVDAGALDETTQSVGVEVDGVDAGIGAVGFPSPDGGVSHR